MAKLLLVEDDVNLREIYAARLQAEGYEVVSASDGEEALAVAVKEKPDLVVLDIMMPKISGFDVLDILRSTPETKHAKIIMMTALSQQSDRERGEQLGADEYLVKSQVTLEDVVNTVKGMLAQTETNASQVIAGNLTTEVPAAPLAAAKPAAGADAAARQVPPPASVTVQPGSGADAAGPIGATQPVDVTTEPAVSSIAVNQGPPAATLPQPPVTESTQAVNPEPLPTPSADPVPTTDTAQPADNAATNHAAASSVPPALPPETANTVEQVPEQSEQPAKEAAVDEVPVPESPPAEEVPPASIPPAGAKTGGSPQPGETIIPGNNNSPVPTL